jgi:CubicO group peptidase (beta-lactamase class C family)
VFAKTLAALCLLQAPVSPGAAPALGKPSLPAEAAGPRDRAELETFIDALAAEQMERHGIPGLAIAVVKDGEIWLAKGYGLADAERKKPVLADGTLFAVASVSKMVTATAVMKLAQGGRVHMDEDINRYLGRFQIDEGRFGPLTLGHLLTHTGGFDEPFTGLIAPPGGPGVSVAAYLTAEMPPRIRPPGELSVYSNIGIALAGEVVEEVAGVPFARFVAENLFQPLGMSRSVFGTPDPALGDRAAGYVPRAGAPRPMGTDYLRNILIPAAGLHATATDMARFMLAHLGAAPEVLNDATLSEMHQRRLSLHPEVAGVTYGSFEHFQNGRRGLVHDGDWDGFASRVFLLPEEKLGFFVTLNTSSTVVRGTMLGKLLDRYYPPRKPASPAVNTGDGGVDLERFEGTYSSGRFPQGTIFKTFKLLARVRITRIGELLRLSTGGSLPNALAYPEMLFRRKGPLLFESVDDGDGQLVFREDASGQLTHLQIEVPEIKVIGQMLFERAPWHAGARFQLVSILVIGALLASGVLWHLRPAVRFARSGPGEATREEGRARLCAACVGLLALAFPVACILSFRTIVVYQSHHLFAAALSIPLLVAALLPALLYFSVLAWSRRFWSVAGRVHYSLFTAASMGYLAVLQYWNLLGFHY